MAYRLERPILPAQKQRQLQLQLLLGWVGAGLGLLLVFQPSLPGLGGALLLLLCWKILSQGHACWGELLAMHCQPERAHRHLRLAAFLQPGDLQNQLNLAHLEADRGQWPAAQRRYQRLLKLAPDCIEAWNGLGFALILEDDYQGACRAFHQAYQLRRGHPGQESLLTATDKTLFPLRCSRLKLRHDLEQWQYLLERGHLPASMAQPLAILENCWQQFNQQESPPALVELPPTAPLAAIWGRNLHEIWLERQTGPCLQPLRADRIGSELQQQGWSCWDHLLQPETLQRLQEFCWQNTLWHDGSRPAGYLASTVDDGFNSPLLWQLGEELRAQLPEQLGALRLVYLWAFKCDSQGQGVALHADSAVFNLNFWITPDQANCDPEHGGLLIYPQEAPPAWDLENLRVDESQIAAWLQQKRAPAVRIPYRCNRAVLFKSRLFHASDTYRFKEGYLHRRININPALWTSAPQILSSSPPDSPVITGFVSLRCAQSTQIEDLSARLGLKLIGANPESACFSLQRFCKIEESMSNQKTRKWDV